MNIIRLIIFFNVCTLITARAQTHDSTFVYHKPLFDFDYSRPIFKLDTLQNANADRRLCYSAYSGYREGVAPVRREFNFNLFSPENKEQGTIRQSAYNASIVELLTHGFPTPLPSHILLEVKDPIKYRYLPAYGDELTWRRKYAYCYELVMNKAAFLVKSLKTVENDFAQHFGLQFGFEKQKVKALVLVRTSQTGQLKSLKEGTPVYGKDGVFRNASFYYLGAQLDAVNQVPFVDETGYREPVDMDLSIQDYRDLPKLRKALQVYGLDLREDIREVEMFVIRETR